MWKSIDALGSQVEISDDKHSVKFKNLTFPNRYYRISLYLNNKIMPSEGEYEFSILGDKDGELDVYKATEATKMTLAKKSLSVIKGKNVSGRISLPDGIVAPSGGITVTLTAHGNQSKTQEFIISENSNHVDYSMDVISGNYTIEYVPSDTNKYIGGFYSTSGNVLDKASASNLDISDNISNLDLSLINTSTDSRIKDTKVGELVVRANGNKTVVENSTSTIIIDHDAKEDYKQGSVTFILPNEFEANASDEIYLSTSSAWSTINALGDKVEISDDKHTVKVKKVTISDGLYKTSLKLLNKIMPAKGNYEFSVKGDKDGEKNNYRETNAQNKDAGPFVVVADEKVVTDNQISGTVSLANGDTAPSGGITGTLFVDGNGEALTILEGENSVAFSRNLEKGDCKIWFSTDNEKYIKDSYYNESDTVSSAELATTVTIDKDTSGLNIVLKEK